MSEGIEDELHVVFECDCLAGIRSRFTRLFSSVTHGDLRAFTNQQPSAAVGSFVHACSERFDVL